ncbi:hypothetical protein SDC9_116466 [bioreactor metagenome]|uniref:Uncharacterized protein n=1 Tax=bioreactor metagenome TaxID=1076179 RepID=A0A645BXY6_9ZZZZ
MVGGHGGDVLRLGAYLRQGEGHSDGLQKRPESGNARFGGHLGMGKIHVAVPNPDGELGKPVYIVEQDVLHPRGQNDRKARAVGAVVKRGELVLNLVAGPVLCAARTAEIVVSQHSRPHEVRPGGVVVRVFKGFGRGGNNSFHQRLAQPVGYVHVLGVGEVPLDNVGQHVRHAAGGLIGGEGAGIAGVQNGKFGPDHIRFRAAPFQVALLQRDDAAIGPFGPRRRDGQHRAHGQNGFNGMLSGEDVPEVPVVGHAHGNGLCRVDDGAAAQGQQKVAFIPAAELDAFVDLSAAGVGLNAGQLAERNSGLF